MYLFILTYYIYIYYNIIRVISLDTLNLFKELFYMLELEMKKIPDNESKEYLKEVISSFENKNYRSSMVMLYAAVMANIIDKLDYLDKTYTIPDAKDILKIVESKDKKYISSKETEMFKCIERKMPYLLNKQAFATIKGLRYWRNLCAHPNLDDKSLARLQEPSMEIVAGFIRESIDNIFLQRAHPNAQISKSILNDLDTKKSGLLNDNDNILQDYLNKIYLVEIDYNSQIYKHVLTDLFKFTFSRTDEICENNRDILCKSLIILIKHKKELSIKTIQEEKLFDKDILIQNENVLNQLCTLFQNFPELYQVPDYLKNSLKEFSRKDPFKYLKNYFLDSKDIFEHQKKLFDNEEEIYTSVNSSEKKLTFSEAFKDCIRSVPFYTSFSINIKSEIKILFNLYLMSGNQEQFWYLANKIYGSSTSFNDADYKFEIWIDPFLSHYNQKAVKDLIEKAGNNNIDDQGKTTTRFNQCSQRGRAKIDHAKVYKRYNELRHDDMSENEFKQKYPNFCKYLDKPSEEESDNESVF